MVEARRALLFVLALVSLTGCAAVFRGSTAKVSFETDPTDAEVEVAGKPRGAQPEGVEIERKATTTIVVRKPGFHDYRTVVKKKVNGAWLTLDIVDCIVTLCIPLIVDATTGAWWDLPEKQVVRLAMVSPTPPTPTVAQAPTGPTPAPSVVVTPAPSAGTQMSESERKAAARAAFLEGVALQNEQKDCLAALSRFEAAQKLWDAPTHRLHIAQCQSQTGRLIEAQENYETLARMSLAPGSPDAFKHAQESAKKELPALKARVPTLRIQVTPAAQTIAGLVVQVNGTQMPVELLGIARPINPGRYRIKCSAPGWRQVTPTEDVRVDESGNKTADVTMTR